MTKSKSKCSPEGSRLRRLRVKLGFTQEGLAQRVGVTTHTIWRLENDPVFSPRLETLRAMAKALGVDAAYFLSSAGERS
jgi:transcriptional regulator with XRE-family HTH domain